MTGAGHARGDGESLISAAVATLILLGVAKSALGAGAWLHGLITQGAGTASPSPLAALQLLTLLVVGVALVVLGYRLDRRAVRLGAAYLVLAASSAEHLYAPLLDARALPAAISITATRLHPDVFLPWLMWLFASEFPSLPDPQQRPRWLRAVRTLSAAMGIALFVLHAALAPAALAIRDGQPTGATQAGWLPLNLYTWVALVGLTGASLAYSLLRARRATRTERRRVRLFLAGIALGTFPAAVAIIGQGLVAPFGFGEAAAALTRRSSPVLRIALLSIPISTGYAVLVNRALDVRLVVRRAIRYALARYTLFAATAIPFMMLALYLYSRREESLASLFVGPRPLSLLALAIGGLAVLQLRAPILRAIDRRFFREQYDAQRILTELVELSRRVGTPGELAGLLAREIDRALHVGSSVVLVRDENSGDLRSPDDAVPTLRADSPLLRLVGDRAEPLVLDETRATRRSHMAREGRDWLAHGPFRVLVPLVTSAGELAGMIALGEKRSELPFTGEDRRLLAAIASSASLTMENRLLLSSPSWRSSSAGDRSAGTLVDEIREHSALECAECLALHAPDAERCPACGGTLTSVPVPLLLAGKFRLERRIGKGGMGVVYRATDIGLGRLLAIKTLPRVSPEFALRLRREARAMASVTHPNLAVIYGGESWHGTPMLLVEYLAGGTLETRIEQGPRPIAEVRSLGLVLCDVLERLHDAGVLHRDLKPSNIGFTLDGQAKLLDFGLAKMLDDSRGRRDIPDRGVPLGTRALLDTKSAARSLTLTHTLVGTPAYLPPEAFAGTPPSTATDLWATAVLLFEALTAKHPFLDAVGGSPLERIERAESLSIERTLPNCPASATRLFARAMALEPQVRPPSARALAELIAELPVESAQSSSNV